VEFLLAAVEAVAEQGEAFVPLYRLSWRDGAWRHLTAPPRPTPALLRLEGPGAPAAGAGPGAPDEPTLARERAAALEEAAARAAALRARWREAPPAWNRPTGDPELDALTWFRYVETDGVPG
jgi:hypothetical protein